jgi:hypothetical protein
MLESEATIGENVFLLGSPMQHIDGGDFGPSGSDGANFTGRIIISILIPVVLYLLGLLWKANAWWPLAAEIGKDVTKEAAGHMIDQALPGCAQADVHWRSAESVGTIRAFEDHLKRFGNCNFAELARERIEALTAQTADGPNRVPRDQALSNQTQTSRPSCTAPSGGDPKPVFYSYGMKFFKGDGTPIVWYYRNANGDVELFDGPGCDPESGETLYPVTKQIAYAFNPDNCTFDSRYVGKNAQGVEVYNTIVVDCPKP